MHHNRTTRKNHNIRMLDTLYENVPDFRHLLTSVTGENCIPNTVSDGMLSGIASIARYRSNWVF
jgi:hypothetical protein